MVRHPPSDAHVLDTGPPDVIVLQFPSTASSGRKLITVSVGGTYGFFCPEFFSSSLTRSLDVFRPADAFQWIFLHRIPLSETKLRIPHSLTRHEAHY
jgi:hypothetical protein